MNNTWFYVALISPALWAAVNIIDDNLTHKVYKNYFSGTVIAGFFSLIPLFLLPFFPIHTPGIQIIFFAFLSGFLYMVSSIFYFRSLMVEVPSIVIALWGLAPVFIPFFAYTFLHEKLHPIQYVGFFLVLIASLAISLTNVKKLKLSSAFFFAVIGTIFYAACALTQKYVYDNTDFWSGYIYISIGMGLSSAFLVLTFSKAREFFTKFHSRYKKFLLIFLINEVINLGAIFFNNLAIALGPVSLVKVIEGTQPLFVLAYALLFFRFSPKHFREAKSGGTVKKIILIGVMLVGLYIIS